MHPSYRVLFLILTASVVLHVSPPDILAILIVYLVLEHLDRWLTKRARSNLFDDIIFGWEQDKDEPHSEEKRGMSRVRLTGENQIITARIADLLRELS
jgi:hypothetical protein